MMREVGAEKGTRGNGGPKYKLDYKYLPIFTRRL